MKIIVFEPGRKAVVKNVQNDLESLQHIVNGYIEILHPFDGPVALVVNEEGKLNRSRANRPFYDDEGKILDILYGTFFLCGDGEDDLTDIPEELIPKYKDMFPLPKDN